MVTTELWAYHAENTVRIMGDYRSQYWPGLIVRLVQGGNEKFFRITNVTYDGQFTYLELHGGGIYTLSTDPITEHQHSPFLAPKGFPISFDLMPQYLTDSDAQGTYLSKSEAQNTYLKQSDHASPSQHTPGSVVPVTQSIPASGGSDQIPSVAAVRGAINNVTLPGVLYTVTLTNTGTDLGTQINDIIAAYGKVYRRIKIVLPANTTWTWNNQVAIDWGNDIVIEGGGWQNGAQNLTVTINMTQNGSFVYGGTTYRVPSRALVSLGSLTICGVIIQESANDSRPLSPGDVHGGLFVMSGGSNASAYNLHQRISIYQSYIYSTEDIISVGTGARGLVNSGWLYAYKRSGSIRDIYVLKHYSGWSFTTGFAVIDISHTTLGSGVYYHNNPHLYYTYTNRVILPEYIGIGTSSPAYRIHLTIDSAAKPSQYWTVPSDARAKEIFEADLNRCLEIVKSLPLRYYKYKEEFLPEGTIHDRGKLGWISDDVEQFFPHAVRIGPFTVKKKELVKEVDPLTGEEITVEKYVDHKVIDDFKYLDSDQIIAALYGAVQKLIQIVEEQQGEIDALRSMIDGRVV